MQTLQVNEKKVSKSLFQFIFPFALKKDQHIDYDSFTKDMGFTRFHLNDEEQQNQYYGEYCISHRDLEANYLPLIGKVLFPHSDKDKGFQRYSKKIGLSCELKTEKLSIPFITHSIDITLCPYDLGFLTIRTELNTDFDFSLSEALEFASLFRVLEPRRTFEKETVIICNDKKFPRVAKFLFDFLFPKLSQFFDQSNMKGSYFESIPFFEDERMFVHSIIGFKEGESVEKVDVYRAAELNGYNMEGTPFVSANNEVYITEYIDRNGYLRWAPNTYYVVEDHCFACVTNEQSQLFSRLAKDFYGEYYYALLLSIFHKVVLLKIANQYSEIQVERDREKSEELIHTINSFNVNFFFLEMVTQSQVRDIQLKLREMFDIDGLYNDTRHTLDNLYRHQEKAASKSTNTLLQILTLYTVISGIYGMNLVIDDLKGHIEWSKMMSYSLFQIIALFTTFSGIIIAVVMGVQSLIKWAHNQRKRWKYDKD